LNILIAILIAVVATSLINLGMTLQKKGAASLPRIGRDSDTSKIHRDGMPP